MYDLKQLEEIINTGNIFRVSLWDSKKGKVIGWNTNRKNIKEHWIRIKSVLTSKFCQNDTYRVLMKKGTSADIVAEVYEIVVKNGKDIPTTMMNDNSSNDTLKGNNDMLTNPVLLQIMNLQSELAGLKAESLFIKQDRERLQTEMYSLQDKIETLQNENKDLSEENRSYLSEQQPSQMEKISTNFLPVIDRYFEIQEKKIEADKNKPDGKNNNSANNDFINGLVEISTGEYFDIKKCNVDSFLSYFEGQEDLENYLLELRAADANKYNILSNRINEQNKKDERPDNKE